MNFEKLWYLFSIWFVPVVWKGAYFPFQHRLPRVTGIVPIMLLFHHEAFLLLPWFPTLGLAFPKAFILPLQFLPSASIQRRSPLGTQFLPYDAPPDIPLAQTQPGFLTKQIGSTGNSATGTPSHLAENSPTPFLLFPSPFWGGFKEMLSGCSSSNAFMGPLGMYPQQALQEEMVMVEMEMQALGPLPWLSPSCKWLLGAFEAELLQVRSLLSSFQWLTVVGSYHHYRYCS